MPRIVLSQEQEEAADKAGGADLKYLLAKQEVQVENGEAGFIGKRQRGSSAGPDRSLGPRPDEDVG